MNRKAPTGQVILVGSGPGDVQLLTLAGDSWIRRADVIVYDRLAPAELLGRARNEAELIYVGKGRAGNAMDQAGINALLVDLARSGKLVVRLKGGDPFIFGRGGEEAAALAEAGLPFQVVPGITAAAAAGAYAGIPLTDRRLAGSVALVTGQEDPARDEERIDYQALAGVDTLVFYMGVKNLPTIVDRLLAAGKPSDTPAACIERATTARQRTIRGTLATIEAEAAQNNVKAPAMIVVGRVIDLADRLAWRNRLPLAGQRILVTRTRRQASDLSARLRDMGAEVLEAPTIRIAPPDDWTAVDAAIERIDRYDILCLTSVNGVAAFCDRMQTLGLDGRALASARIAAVGKTTAKALQARFLNADIVPDAFTGQALGKALGKTGDLAGKRILLARADIAPPHLPDALRGMGAIVDEVTVYRTLRPADLPPAAAEALATGDVDWVTFTSSSTVTNFLELAGRDAFASVRIASIGPVTSATLAEAGLAATVAADPHTIAGLADAIAAATTGDVRP